MGLGGVRLPCPGENLPASGPQGCLLYIPEGVTGAWKTGGAAQSDRKGLGYGLGVWELKRWAREWAGTGQGCRHLTAGPGLRLLAGTPRVTSAPSDDQSWGAFKVLTCVSPASGGCRPCLQIGKLSLGVTLISAPRGSGLKFQSSPNCHCCSLAHDVLVCNTGVAPGAWNSVLSSDVKTPLLGGMERGSWGQPFLLAPLPQWRHRLGMPYRML